MEILDKLEENMKQAELISVAKTLNKTHNPYLMDFQIWKNLSSILGDEYRSILNLYKDLAPAHKVLNDIIMKYCPGERIIKYNLVKEHLSIKDEITLFEMNVDNSRVDMGRVNGHSYAFEIKTEFDSTTRLEKQVSDYLKVFEYVYVICHKSHLGKIKSLLPAYCGIKSYILKDGQCKFKSEQRALKNNNIDYESQLRNLSSEDLRVIIKEMRIKEIPNTRREREVIIREKCNTKSMNKWFKFAIKHRYTKQWQFICSNFNSIHPVDIQSFFNSPVDPDLLYSKSIYINTLEL